MIQNGNPLRRETPVLLLIFTLALLEGCAPSEPAGEPAHPTPAVPVADDALIEAMKTTFGAETALIQHTLEVYRYALDIQQHEGGDLFVIKAAALFHDIGIPRARELHGENATDYYEVEGPPVAREVFAELGVPQEKVRPICGIIENHHSARVDAVVSTPEFRVIWDADWLATLIEMPIESGQQEAAGTIDTILRTERGKELAKARLTQKHEKE